MKLKVLREAGYEEALLGLSLSYNQPIENMPSVALKLFNKEDGHNQFLESIVVWLDITAPRYWWTQFNRYRIGVSPAANGLLSESTMHTILKKELTQDNFEDKLFPLTLLDLNFLVATQNFTELKNALPEGFLQRRIVCTNYKTLRHIIKQRLNHKLPQWITFVSGLHALLERPEFIEDLLK